MPMQSSGNLQYRVIVGMEIHIHLATESKMFCPCPNRFGDEPNSNVCPVCLGSPGVLPVMNRRAVEYALRTALALKCEIAAFTKWDRKNYYYPDLPKNYQISQYDLPLAQHGVMDIPVDGQLKTVRIRRLHLEEDAAKLLHEGLVAASHVDLNRAGTPLMEIVTEPDLASADEAHAFGSELRSLVRYLGVSEANMQQGQMRLEPNVNLAIVRDGQEYRTPIAEVKNLGSLRALQRAVEFEVQRQLDEFERTGATMQMGNKSTRGWDEGRGATVLQREKEEAHDYRYFPDPDLAPVTPEPVWIEQVRSELPELPVHRRRRFVEQFGFSEKDVGKGVDDRATADLFERALAAGAPVRNLANQFISFWAMHANQRGVPIAELPVPAERMATLAAMVEQGTVNATTAAAIAEKMLAEDTDPQAIAERENLVQVSDSSEIEKLVDEVLAANPQAVADASSEGKKQKKAFGFLTGQVMQKSRGQANPKIVNELLQKKLRSS